MTGIYIAGVMATAIVVNAMVDRHNAKTKRWSHRIRATEQIATVVFAALFWPFVAFLYVALMGEGDD